MAASRLWRLSEAGVPDYDSVSNWQVVRELAGGDFAHLFHHGSPGFLLLFVPVAWLTRQLLVFQVLNALLGVAGLGWFGAWVARRAELSGPAAAGLVLLGGTSLLLTYSGRDFTMNSVSLVVFAGLLRSHFARLHRPAQQGLVPVAAWLALGLCVNYKFLFAVPILAVLEWWRADGAVAPRRPPGAAGAGGALRGIGRAGRGGGAAVVPLAGVLRAHGGAQGG